jgi:hypothetical protein
LARAGIDGVKYPVDSYGGKTVKDGDKAGWNYVSFRDDNIRVDHKWTDGVARFSRGGVGAARKMSNDGSEYSYAGLTARPGMKLAQINPESFKNYRTDAERVRDAKDSVLAAGGRKIDGAVVIDMDGSDVVVSSSGIKHRGKKPHLENDMLYPVLGEVLKNAIPVNELAPRSGDKRDFGVKNTFVFLGAFAYKNEICPVRIQVVQKNNTRTLDSVDVLKSLNTKIGKVNAPDKSDLTREAPSALAEFGKIDAPDKSDLTYEAPSALAKISIANLIDVAQPLHPEIFSRDVADALKVTYRGKEINARFQRVRGVDWSDITMDIFKFVPEGTLTAMGETEQNHLFPLARLCVLQSIWQLAMLVAPPFDQAVT